MEVLKLIDECINFLETHSRKFNHSNKDSSKNKTILTALEKLHKNFIVGPIGEANGNITTNNAFKTYAMVIHKTPTKARHIISAYNVL